MCLCLYAGEIFCLVKDYCPECGFHHWLHFYSGKLIQTAYAQAHVYRASAKARNATTLPTLTENWPHRSRGRLLALICSCVYLYLCFWIRWSVFGLKKWFDTGSTDSFSQLLVKTNSVLNLFWRMLIYFSDVSVDCLFTYDSFWMSFVSACRESKWLLTLYNHKRRIKFRSLLVLYCLRIKLISRHVDQWAVRCTKKHAVCFFQYYCFYCISRVPTRMVLFKTTEWYRYFLIVCHSSRHIPVLNASFEPNAITFADHAMDDLPN